MKSDFFIVPHNEGFLVCSNNNEEIALFKNKKDAEIFISSFQDSLISSKSSDEKNQKQENELQKYLLNSNNLENNYTEHVIPQNIEQSSHYQHICTCFQLYEQFFLLFSKYCPYFITNQHKLLSNLYKHTLNYKFSHNNKNNCEYNINLLNNNDNNKCQSCNCEKKIFENNKKNHYFNNEYCVNHHKNNIENLLYNNHNNDDDISRNIQEILFNKNISSKDLDLLQIQEKNIKKNIDNWFAKINQNINTKINQAENIKHKLNQLKIHNLNKNKINN